MRPHIACLSLAAGLVFCLVPAHAADTGKETPARDKAEWVSPDGRPVASGNPVDATGRIRTYNGPAVRLMRTDAASPKGTILLFPGGGYSILSAVSEGERTARFLNQCGFDAAILEYHIASGDKTRDLALADALACWRLVRTETRALGLHGGRFGMMGYSAGGHLAARATQALAANPRDAQPDELILVYPAYLDECAKDSARPAVLPPAAPTGRLFLLIAANDVPRWVTSSEIYAKGWKGLDGRETFHLLPDGGHGFGMGDNRPGAAKEWPDRLKAFLEAGPETAPAKPSNNGRLPQKVAAGAPEPVPPTPVSPNTAVIPVPKLENDGYDWMGRHNEILKIKAALDPDLVFVGDSITHAWGGLPAAGARKKGERVLRTAFAGHRVLNLGFGWDRTQNVLWRLDNGEFAKLHPKFVVLNIGTNNTSGTPNARQNTPDEIADGVRAICDRIRKQAPQAKIILMAVFPREEKPDHPRRLLIAEINKRLAGFGGRPGITFLDIGPKFLNPDGTIPRALMSDFCHPTEKGYQLWADALAPLLKP